MKQNSILFLTNAYPDSESSYRGVFIKKLASLLQENGYQISIVTPRIYKASHFFEEQNGIKVYRFPFFAGNRLLIEYQKIPYLRMLLYYTNGFLLTLYAALRNGCSLIHAHWAIPTGLIGVWAGVLTRKPLTVTIHGSDLRMALEKSNFVRRLFIYVCKKADQLNCVSGVQKKELERLGISAEKISTIPMGIDTAFLNTGENREGKSNTKSITIFSNRSLLPIYNVSLLIRAIPIILKEEPETKFRIAGNGSERKSLEREVENLNVSSSVEFLGQVPHEEMPNLLSHADIYVSTSLHDGTSVSLLEAMAAGVFPVVTDIPGNREWITDGDNGFLVAVNKEKFLAEKIVEAIRNRDLMERSRDKNFCLIKEKALWLVTMAKTKEIYKMALDSKS
jgi:glycosyltransferase involved in cell wall biosynthesis